MEKVILAAGGTGGHVFSACALSLELRKRGYNTILITDQRGVKYLHHEFSDVVVLPISRLGWKFFIFSPYLFILCLVKSFRVKKTIAFGGYASFFPILAAIVSLQRFFIVQLDSVVTRLNRFFLSYASKVFYLFPQTNFKKSDSHLFLTGAPIRSGFEFSFIRHSCEDFVISIFGGSLGSSYWRDLLFQFAKSLPLEIQQKISLYIQTNEDISFLDSFFFKSIQAEAFFDTRKIFRKSHLIITRCGANTLAEIVSVGRPAFLVPWDEAVEDHQVRNAENLLDLGGCAMGTYVELLTFFNKLYYDENFFIKTCSDIASAFEFEGKDRIADLL